METIKAGYVVTHPQTQRLLSFDGVQYFWVDKLEHALVFPSVEYAESTSANWPKFNCIVKIIPVAELPSVLAVCDYKGDLTGKEIWLTVAGFKSGKRGYLKKVPRGTSFVFVWTEDIAEGDRFDSLAGMKAVSYLFPSDRVWFPCTTVKVR